MDNYGHLNTDPKVEAAIAGIEADFKTKVLGTLGDINELLATEPEDTEILHQHAKSLHGIVEEIDRNARRRWGAGINALRRSMRAS